VRGTSHPWGWPERQLGRDTFALITRRLFITRPRLRPGPIARATLHLRRTTESAEVIDRRLAPPAAAEASLRRTTWRRASAVLGHLRYSSFSAPRSLRPAKMAARLRILGVTWPRPPGPRTACAPRFPHFLGPTHGNAENSAFQNLYSWY
jgi:hypothetical protein